MLKQFHFPDVRRRLDDGRYFIPAKVADVSFHQAAAARCYENQCLTLVRDRKNKYDPHAIMVFAGLRLIGSLPRKYNECFALYMDQGHFIDADICKIVGGDGYKSAIAIHINLYFPPGSRLELESEGEKFVDFQNNHTNPSLFSRAITYLIRPLNRIYKQMKSDKNENYKSFDEAGSSSGRHYESNLRASSSFSEYDDDDWIYFDDDEFDEYASENETPATWLKSHERINIRGYEITKGNFYFGGRLPAQNSRRMDASLIDDSLNAVNQPISYEDDSLSYDPQYNSISAECRGAYLNWLAGSRDDPATRLGYVFLYFYGLERRIIENFDSSELNDEEFRIIFQEVLRLNRIYGEPLSFENDKLQLMRSHSFQKYSSELLEIMCILRPNVVSPPDLSTIFKRNSKLFEYKLAKTINDGKPVPTDMAWAWLLNYSGYRFKTPARRCADEFNELFYRIYSNRYEGGIVANPKGTRINYRLEIKYEPASPSLYEFNIPLEDLPQPYFLWESLNRVLDVAVECNNALVAYSRYLGKQNTSRTDIAALLLLPEELSDLADSRGLDQFRKWAEERTARNRGLVDVSEFWKFTKLPLPTKINKKESDFIQAIADKSGFGVVPDARYHDAKPSIDGKLVLFLGGHGKNFKPSKSFIDMGTTLRLGAMVSIDHSHAGQPEFALLNQLIGQKTNLSSVEKHSLHSYLVWRLNTPANRIGLKARLETMNAAEKAAVGELLIDVALADSKHDPAKIRQVEKLYALLGLDKSRVSLDIHSRITGENSLAGDDRLDTHSIAAHEKQTKEAQSFLDDIFADEEQVDEANAQDKIESDQAVSGLDDQHYALYERLTAESKWSRDEFDSLCNGLGLMSGAAVEFINEWSFERVDAPVIEESDDAICIDREIVEELEA